MGVVLVDVGCIINFDISRISPEIVSEVYQMKMVDHLSPARNALDIRDDV